MERISETKLTLKVLGLSWVGSFKDLVLFVCVSVVFLWCWGIEPQISYMLENCSTKGLGPQLLVQHFKIVSINSCFTYKNSNFIWLNTLNKYSGPMLKGSIFSFLATINTTRKFAYRGSWVFPSRCWASGSFATSIVCSSNNPKYQYLYHCHWNLQEVLCL